MSSTSLLTLGSCPFRHAMYVIHTNLYCKSHAMCHAADENLVRRPSQVPDGAQFAMYAVSHDCDDESCLARNDARDNHDLLAAQDKTKIRHPVEQGTASFLVEPPGQKQRPGRPTASVNLCDEKFLPAED